MNELNTLLTKVAQQDQKAFAELYRVTSPKLLSLAKRLANQDINLAEDILQDAFIKIWTKADKYNQSKGTAISWMVTVVRNQAYDRFRSFQSRPVLVAEGDFEGLEYAGKDNSPSQTSEQAEQLAIFNSMLEELPANQKEAVTQSLVYGFSHSEIAESLGVPLGTVKAWLRRNLLVFQTELSKEACVAS